MIKTIIFEALSTAERINRARFLRNVFILLSMIPIYVGFLLMLPTHLRSNSLLTVFFFVIAVFVLISLFSQAFKRLKDIGSSPFLLFLIFLPLGNFGLFVYLAAKRGISGTNRYGEDPLLSQYRDKSDSRLRS